MAKVELSQIGKTKVNGDQRNRQRGEKLQDTGGEKRQAQHFHCPLAEILRGLAYVVRLRFAAMKNTQRFHTAQAIEKMAA